VLKCDEEKKSGDGKTGLFSAPELGVGRVRGEIRR
jgi:hypothetical protein